MPCSNWRRKNAPSKRWSVIFSRSAKQSRRVPDLARLVTAPVFSRDEQKKGMDAILRRMEMAPLTVRFVLLLAVKGRLFVLADAIRAFLLLAAKLRGEIDAEVTSARTLSEPEILELKSCAESQARPRCAAGRQGRPFPARRSRREGGVAHDRFVAAHQTRLAAHRHERTIEWTFSRPKFRQS